MPSDKSSVIVQKDRESGTPTPPTEERESGRPCAYDLTAVARLRRKIERKSGPLPDCGHDECSVNGCKCTTPADAEGEPIVHFDGMPPTADRSPCGASDDADKVAWRQAAVTCQPCIDAIKARSAR